MTGRESGPPRPVTLRSLPGLAWRTAMADRATYVRSASARPLAIIRSVWPALGAPIFIIGAPRSGTTFLGSCIAALPEVSYHFEPIATKAAARYVYEGLWRAGTARRFYRGVYRWLLRIHLDGGMTFAEKTPRNCFIIGFLARSFPGARFLFIFRDGRDAALSLSKQPWLKAESQSSSHWEPGGYRHGPHPRFWVEPARRTEFMTTSDLHRSIWAWRRHNEAALEQTAHLPEETVLELRYEDLARTPALESERVLDFLEIASPVSRSRLTKAASGAVSGAVGRWREELTAAELELIARESGGMLHQLGYTGSGDPQAW